MYKPLNQCIAQSDELKKLIRENPDLPIVVMVDSEVCADDSFRWWFAPDIRFEVGDFLDCEQDVDDERVFDDKDDFEECLADRLGDGGDYDETSDEEFDRIVAEKLKEYEPYWKKVIYIRAMV